MQTMETSFFGMLGGGILRECVWGLTWVDLTKKRRIFG